MAEFTRARSEEQKNMRMQAIKDATAQLFSEKPYNEITLTTIAAKLEWTRVNLYQYVSTKEEIFLEICSDKRDAYYDALKTAFPPKCGYSLEVFAQVWAGILNAHREHLHYCDILSTIIETNVSVEKLASFKKRYYEHAYELCDLLGDHLGTSREITYKILLNIYYHSVGVDSLCRWNPLVSAALKKINMTAPKTDFRENMQEFILLNLERYCKQEA